MPPRRGVPAGGTCATRDRAYFVTHLPASIRVAFGQMGGVADELAAIVVTAEPADVAAITVKPKQPASIAELATATATLRWRNFITQPFGRPRAREPRTHASGTWPPIMPL